ncbi:dihydroxyacetone kinase subunit DhaL [Scopulibacillus cellulosilyticus]|uniref:Dihydroxyacetone kinase subunit DhaL n=1 Tax=Scopulibacillus cellulosilyticus TaxID=2665665 RepID=A0ABW2PXA5_9BACL
MIYSANDLKQFFKNVVEMIEDKKDYLSELDRKLGDGDHGVTMSIGWQAVNEQLDSDLKDEEDCTKISMAVARTFLSAVGSSVGPLYATGLLRGAKIAGNKSELNDSDLVNYWAAFVDGVKERGGAEVGDKTMMDTLIPFSETLKKQFTETGEASLAFESAVEAAKQGMESTKDLLSKKGRSSRLGERSKGAIDPGAASAYLILSIFLDSIKSLQHY